MNLLTIKNLPELPFEVTEAINQLRVNLSLCGSNVKKIMITSSVPNEGKSFVAMHLWRSMAELGKKTLLIDCDLRNSEMRSKYNLSGLEKISGLAYFLAGQVNLNDAIYRTNVANGYIIPVTTAISNPSMLLEDPLFKGMLAECLKVFDYIILDTPPLASVADALKIATNCDGSVLVVRGGATPRKLVQNSVQLLQKTGKPLLGTVLNRVNAGKGSSRYYYRQYYYGGYGEQPSKQKGNVKGTG